MNALNRLPQTSPAHYLGIANAMSYLSLVCGLAAVFAAERFSSWELAGCFIGLSALADTFDGKFAGLFRRTEREKEFGVQLDSLVDAAAFGVVPVVCLSALAPIEVGWTWVVWATAAAFYVICAVTRLGFYNLHGVDSATFIGVPTTLAGLLWSTLFLAHPSAGFTTVALAAMGLGMISSIRVKRPQGRWMTGYLLWFVLVFVSHGVALGRVWWESAKS